MGKRGRNRRNGRKGRSMKGEDDSRSNGRSSGDSGGPSGIGKRPLFNPLVFIAIAAIVVCASAGLYFAYGKEGDGGEVYRPDTGDIPCIDGDGGSGSVSTTHAIGSGDADYWTVNPTGHAMAGQFVAHPSWVGAECTDRVLLILDHSEGCMPCVQQTADIKSIMTEQAYSQGVEYVDLLSTGTDPRAQECFAVYDPDGTEHYIPLTIIVVKHKDGRYLWHSWEGVTGKDNLKTWLDDAMTYRGA